MKAPRKILAAGVVVWLALSQAGRGAEERPLTIVVMDPLAAPLSCPCVQGYAQRNYDKLGAYLAEELGRPVEVFYGESLAKVLNEDTDGRADLVIGKRSVVVAQAKGSRQALKPALALTGKDGLTTQTGLIVVPAADPAKTVADLKGYRIIFGTPDCEEKHAAALALLKEQGVAAPEKPETCAACSDGATEILELGPQVRAATVISSYAAPLLEGCGTIKKGDLRVVGTTAAVPFVTVFLSSRLTSADRESIVEALLQTAHEPALLVALESQSGFVAAGDAASAPRPDETAKKKN